VGSSLDYGLKRSGDGFAPQHAADRGRLELRLSPSRYHRPMARPLRLQFSGALYHVTARGNERKPIFRDERDRPAQVRKHLG